MTLEEKFLLREKISEEQLRFQRRLDVGCFGTLIFLLSLMPISYKIVCPTKECVVNGINERDKQIYAYDIKDTTKLYKICYGSECSVGYNVPKTLKYGDVLKCVGPRGTNRYYFSFEVKRINGMKKAEYFKKQQEKIK